MFSVHVLMTCKLGGKNMKQPNFPITESFRNNIQLNILVQKQANMTTLFYVELSK